MEKIKTRLCDDGPVASVKGKLEALSDKPHVAGKLEQRLGANGPRQW